MQSIVISKEPYCLPIEIVVEFFRLKKKKAYIYLEEEDNDYLTLLNKRQAKTVPNDKLRCCLYKVKKLHKNIYFDYSPLVMNLVPRKDKTLVKAVRWYLKKNPKFTALKIVSIPNRVEWYLHTYSDGCECINEKHRSWH